MVTLSGTTRNNATLPNGNCVGQTKTVIVLNAGVNAPPFGLKINPLSPTEYAFVLLERQGANLAAPAVTFVWTGTKWAILSTSPFNADIL